MQPVLSLPHQIARAAYASTGFVSYGVGGTSTHVADDKFGNLIDRFSYARRYRGALVFSACELTVASCCVLTLSQGMQDAAATSGPWADVGSRVTNTIGTPTSSDTAPTIAAPQAGVNLSGARRYVRSVFQIATLASATSSGQTVAIQGQQVVLMSADELPTDQQST